MEIPESVQVALINAASEMAAAKITQKGWKFDNYVRPMYWFDNSLQEVVKAYASHISASISVKEEYICPNCGGKGWSANCEKCIPY